MSVRHLCCRFASPRSRSSDATRKIGMHEYLANPVSLLERFTPPSLEQWLQIKCVSNISAVAELRPFGSKRKLRIACDAS